MWSVLRTSSIQQVNHLARHCARKWRLKVDYDLVTWFLKSGLLNCRWWICNKLASSKRKKKCIGSDSWKVWEMWFQVQLCLLLTRCFLMYKKRIITPNSPGATRGICLLCTSVFCFLCDNFLFRWVTLKGQQGKKTVALQCIFLTSF